MVERQSGQPIAGAEIRMRFVDRQATHVVAATDASGRFDMPVPAGEVWASVHGRGYGPLNFPLSRDHASDDRSLRLELARGAELGVEVRDPEGRPVSGIRVHVQADGEDVALDEGVRVSRGADQMRWDALTDAAGRAELSDLPASAPLDLSLYRGEEVRHIEPVALELAAGARRQLRIELRGGTRVVGSVVDDRGQGVPGIQLSLGTELQIGFPSYHYGGKALTGAQGEFVFESVPAGRWSVSADRETRTLGLFVTQRSLRIDPGVSEVRVVLSASRDLFIEGQVLRADGQPARGIGVSSFLDGEMLSKGFAIGNAFVETDASGRFRLGPLPPGSHRISAGMQVAHASPGDPPLVLRLPAIGKLRGRIVDARTRAPLRADVRLRSVEDIWGYSDSTLDGAFAFDGVVAGRYELRAHTGQGELGTLGPIDVRADRTVDGLEIQVRPAATLMLESREAHGSFTVSDARGHEWCSELARGNTRRCVIEPGLAIVRWLGEKREVLDEVQVTLLRGEQRTLVLGRATDR